MFVFAIVLFLKLFIGADSGPISMDEENGSLVIRKLFTLLLEELSDNSIEFRRGLETLTSQNVDWVNSSVVADLVLSSKYKPIFRNQQDFISTMNTVFILHGLDFVYGKANCCERARLDELSMFQPYRYLSPIKKNETELTKTFNDRIEYITLHILQSRDLIISSKVDHGLAIQRIHSRVFYSYCMLALMFEVAYSVGKELCQFPALLADTRMKLEAARKFATYRCLCITNHGPINGYDDRIHYLSGITQAQVMSQIGVNANNAFAPDRWPLDLFVLVCSSGPLGSNLLLAMIDAVNCFHVKILRCSTFEQVWQPRKYFPVDFGHQQTNDWFAEYQRYFKFGFKCLFEFTLNLRILRTCKIINSEMNAPLNARVSFVPVSVQLQYTIGPRSIAQATHTGMPCIVFSILDHVNLTDANRFVGSYLLTLLNQNLIENNAHRFALAQELNFVDQSINQTYETLRPFSSLVLFFFMSDAYSIFNAISEHCYQISCHFKHFICLSKFNNSQLSVAEYMTYLFYLALIIKLLAGKNSLVFVSSLKLMISLENFVCRWVNCKHPPYSLLLHQLD